MNWATLLPWSIFALLVAFLGIVYHSAKAHSVCRVLKAQADGQAMVAMVNAESVERTARANAYFTQVQSLEQAWQAFLENHITINHDQDLKAQDLRVLRAAFENMYDFSGQVKP